MLAPSGFNSCMAVLKMGGLNKARSHGLSWFEVERSAEVITVIIQDHPTMLRASV